VKVSPGEDRVLGVGGDPVHVVRGGDAVPVDIGAERGEVGDVDLELVAHVDLDPGSGDLAVVGPPSTNLPGSTSHSITSAVNSKTLVPSALISTGSSGWLPLSSVSAGKASIDSIIAMSICSGVMSSWLWWLVSATSAHDELCLHPRLPVTGDRTENRVCPRLQLTDRERGGLPAGDVVGNRTSFEGEVVDLPTGVGQLERDIPGRDRQGSRDGELGKFHLGGDGIGPLRGGGAVACSAGGSPYGRHHGQGDGEYPEAGEEHQEAVEGFSAG
jgi:hypothetical protein